MGDRDWQLRNPSGPRRIIVTNELPGERWLRLTIGAPGFTEMKETAVLANSARGPLVDEEALVAHCRSHPSFRAGAATLAAADVVAIVTGWPVWPRAANVADVLPFLGRGEPSKAAPSIVNADELELPRLSPARGARREAQ